MSNIKILTAQEILDMAQKAVPQAILFSMHDSRDGTSFIQAADYEGVYQEISEAWNLDEYTLDDIDRIKNYGGSICFGAENEEELIFSSETHAQTFVEFLQEKLLEKS